MPKQNDKNTPVIKNRKALHDYIVLDTYEAGIALTGPEVKSVRAGNVNLKDAYCTVTDDNRLVLKNVHISAYHEASFSNVDPTRDRALLMHGREIRKLKAVIMRDGNTIVPLDMHFAHGLVKLTVAVCKGRKNYDKREADAARSAKREMERASKERRCHD